MRSTTVHSSSDSEADISSLAAAEAAELVVDVGDSFSEPVDAIGEDVSEQVADGRLVHQPMGELLVGGPIPQQQLTQGLVDLFWHHRGEFSFVIAPSSAFGVDAMTQPLGGAWSGGSFESCSDLTGYPPRTCHFSKRCRCGFLDDQKGQLIDGESGA